MRPFACPPVIKPARTRPETQKAHSAADRVHRTPGTRHAIRQDMTETPAPLPVDKTTGEPLSPVYKRRVSAKVRKAFTDRLRYGLPWDQCAERAGLAEASLHKARNQPHVDALWTQMEAQFVQEVADGSARRKARALQVAEELLERSPSEAVRAKMVEFLAGERPGTPQVSVNIQQNIGSNGYEYAPPGVRIVDVTPGTGDSQSPSHMAQDVENIDES